MNHLLIRYMYLLEKYLKIEFTFAIFESLFLQNKSINIYISKVFRT